MPIESDSSIDFIGVSKRFQIQEGRTLREFIPALAKGRGWTPPFYALRDVNLSIARGETVGFVGRNGSGKSTALKLMCGVMVPTEGEVRIRGRVSPLIELGAGFHPDFTGRENIFLNASILGMANKEIRAKFEEIVSFAELWEFIDTPVKRYSSGMYMRLGFAVAIYSDPDILLVDEVLSVGDAAFQGKCLAKMHEFQERGVTIVLVSHGLDMVQRFCQRAFLLDAGHLVQEGEPAAVIQRYMETISGVAHVG